MKDFLRKNKLSVVIGAILLVFTVLLCIPATIKVFAGVFGYAVYLYLAIGYAALVLRFKKIKPNIATGRLILYILTALFVLLTLHVGIIGREVVESGFGGYIGTTYERATVGGVVLSVISCPIVLPCKYIASVIILLLLAAVCGFLCILPYLFEQTEKSKKKKEKKAKAKPQEVFPPVIEDAATEDIRPSHPTQEPIPTDPKVVATGAEEKEEPPVGSREYAYRALFGTDMPARNQASRPTPSSAQPTPTVYPSVFDKKPETVAPAEQPKDRYRIIDDVYATVVKPDDSVYTNNYLAEQRRKEAHDKLFGVPPSESARVDFTADRTVRKEVEEGIKYTPYVPSQSLYDSAVDKPEPAQPQEAPSVAPYVVTYEKPMEIDAPEPEPVEEPVPDFLPTPGPTVETYDDEPEEELYTEPVYPIEEPVATYDENTEEEEDDEDALPTLGDSERLRALNAQAGVDAPRSLYSDKEVVGSAPEPEPEPIPQEEPRRTFERFSPIAPATPEQPAPAPAPAPETPKAEKPVKKRARKKYVTPPESMLIDRPYPTGYQPFVENLGLLKDVIENQAQALGLSMTLIDAIKGPTVTFCTVALGAGCQVKKVTSVQQDLALLLHAKGDINIVKQIPGTPYIGIEIPNNVVGSVSLKEVLTSDEYKNAKGDLVVALGKYSRGEIMVADLADWPHALIAGSSGSGKSVCLNAILVSLIYRYSPFDLQMVLIDKKKVEMIDYAGLPHMLFKDPLTDDDEICRGITWLQKETERRFDVLMKVKAKNLNTFNAKMPESEQMSRILIVIDEASELMTKPNLRKIVEPALSSISRIGRACGVHMIFATQTPSRDVITSEIQNNFNTKIAFRVGEFGHSMVILKSPGAEKLLGKGDMLYRTNKGETLRGQGLYVSDEEIEGMVEYIIQNNEPEYDEEFIEATLHAGREEPAEIPSSDSAPAASGGAKSGFVERKNPEADEAFLDFAKQVMKIFVDSNRVSATYIQRKFAKGYNTIANVMDYLEDKGYVSPQSGNKRNLLITKEEFYTLYPEMRDADPDDDDGV
ncbi:MAG: hypothetical protein IJ735_05440 [Clostridia bacterium]|nr:hypothetical protein [Clostridia bacterium]